MSALRNPRLQSAFRRNTAQDVGNPSDVEGMAIPLASLLAASTSEHSAEAGHTVSRVGFAQERPCTAVVRS